MNIQLTYIFNSFTLLLVTILCHNSKRLCSAYNFSSPGKVIPRQQASWMIEVAPGEDINAVKLVAQKHGFRISEKVFGNVYVVKRDVVQKRSLAASDPKSFLADQSLLLWSEPVRRLRRFKRDFVPQDGPPQNMDAENFANTGSSVNGRFLWKAPGAQGLFSDPDWNNGRTWYLTRPEGGTMRVQGAWRHGYYGQGVVVTILDDGVEHNHTELKVNYDPRASYDINGGDPDPMPRYNENDENRHGTRCAGVVAANANNNFCTVGVAYRARIGGIRMLDGDVTDLVEARAVSFKNDYVGIYSASWGPEDDGKTVDGPGYATLKAFQEGAWNGRNGLGCIYVWASGNGGRNADSCACDGYVNLIYTISISSATENGNVPWYAEACSATLASTYSSGAPHERHITTSDLHNKCTHHHTGTSASAPLAAGLFALLLSANQSLTWRDVQHIAVMTSDPTGLHALDWKTTGIGRRVSHYFGYGLLDASAMVQAALNWSRVPEQHQCHIAPGPRDDASDPSRPIQIPPFTTLTLSLTSNGCRDSPRNTVVFLEHVQIQVTLRSTRRGELQITLTSPHGTESVMLPKRPHDNVNGMFDRWSFTTTHSWGEIGIGQWTLQITNGASSAELLEWRLILYGTARMPAWLQQIHNTTDAELDAFINRTIRMVSNDPAQSPHSSNGALGSGAPKPILLRWRSSTSSVLDFFLLVAFCLLSTHTLLHFTTTTTTTAIGSRRDQIRL